MDPKKKKKRKSLAERRGLLENYGYMYKENSDKCQYYQKTIVYVWAISKISLFRDQKLEKKNFYEIGEVIIQKVYTFVNTSGTKLCYYWKILRVSNDEFYLN